MIESCSIQEQIVLLCTNWHLHLTLKAFCWSYPLTSQPCYSPHMTSLQPPTIEVELASLCCTWLSCTWLGFSVQYIYSSISIRSSVVHSRSGPIWALLTHWLPKYDILGGRTGRHDKAMILVGRLWGLAKLSSDDIQSKYLKDAIKPLIFYYCYRKKLLVLHSAVTHICPF